MNKVELLFKLMAKNNELKEKNNKIIDLQKENKEPKKIENIYEIQNGDFLEMPDTHDLMKKLNEIIDYINKGE